MKYCNEDFDALMADAAVEPDLETQVGIYNQAQEMLVEDAPVIFISWGGRFTLVKPWVQGPDPDAAGLLQRRVLLHQRHHRGARVVEAA